MKIYDITQELLSSNVFPGDPAPEMTRLSSIADGAACNLSSLSMCLHNGTHADALCHFVDGAPGAEKLSLETFIGECEVVAMFDPDITGADIDNVPDGTERLLIKGFGRSRLTKSAALAMLDRGIRLVGIDHQTIGVDGQEAEVHRILQRAGIIILEGLDLSGIPSGPYLLIAPPLKIAGADGAPCRAVLLHE